MSIFGFHIALYDKRKVVCDSLNDHENLTIDHGIIMENSWNFMSYFVWEPCLVPISVSSIDDQVQLRESSSKTTRGY